MLTSHLNLLPWACRLVLLLATSTGFTTAQTVNAVIPGRARIFGKLLDDSGDAIPRMHVEALASTVSLGEPSYEPVGQNFSDKSGSYTLYLTEIALPANVYVVAVPEFPSFNSQCPPSSTKGSPQPIRTYYPNAKNRAQAKLLKVDPEAEIHLDIHVQFSPLFKVAGKLTHDLLEDSPQGHFVDLLVPGSEDDEYSPVSHADVNRSGTFTLPCVPPGIYELFVGDNGQWPNLRRCLPKISVKSSDLRGVSAKLDPSFHGF